MEGLEPSGRSLSLKVSILYVAITLIILTILKSTYHSLYVPHKEVTNWFCSCRKRSQLCQAEDWGNWRRELDLQLQLDWSQCLEGCSWKGDVRAQVRANSWGRFHLQENQHILHQGWCWDQQRPNQGCVWKKDSRLVQGCWGLLLGQSRCLNMGIPMFDSLFGVACFFLSFFFFSGLGSSVANAFSYFFG